MELNPQLDMSNPAVAERVEMLLAYYPRDPLTDNLLLFAGWTRQHGSDGFLRFLGGADTPFVHYELYVTPFDGRWIPSHGSVAMEPADTAAEAANRLMDFWHALDFRDRLKSEVYRQLVELSRVAEADPDEPSRPRPTGS